MTDQGNVTRTKVPQKVLRYFPLGPTLQRLICRDILRSPWFGMPNIDRKMMFGDNHADSKAWSKLDSIDPTLGMRHVGALRGYKACPNCGP
ncbi:hypothetical protein M0R45_006757 [Rubus argutus]|uniref:Uncharacterized protein n=1 Tax=Rubus argutus TaxID=59490 RepID=A0AAW1YRG7_RUBAR